MRWADPFQLVGKRAVENRRLGSGVFKELWEFGLSGDIKFGAYGAFVLVCRD